MTGEHEGERSCGGAACARGPGGVATRLFLMPGDLICNAIGFRGESDHRQILRSFFNMLIWGALSVTAALEVML